MSGGMTSSAIRREGEFSDHGRYLVIDSVAVSNSMPLIGPSLTFRLGYFLPIPIFRR